MTDTTDHRLVTTAEAAETCRNCHAILHGEYCALCGQREGARDLQFLDFSREISADFFVWNSGLWKSLAALIFRPGFLTAEHMSGRRARYLPPLRLYLVISFIMFLLVSFSSSDGGIIINTDLSESEKQEKLDTLNAKLDDRSLTDHQKEEIRKHAKAHLDRGVLAELDRVQEGNDAEQTVNFDYWDEGEKPEWATNLEKKMTRNISGISENPQQFTNQFIERLPYLMFVLLPLFAMLVHLSYLFSRYHYLQHLIFSLHYHSAVFLLFSIGMVANLLSHEHIGGWAVLWSFLYLPIALVKVYGSGYWAALGKSLFIAFGEMLLLLLTLSVLALVSVAIFQ